MAKKLYLEFENSTGDKKTLSFNDPKEDLDEMTVREKADLIVSSEAFEAKGAKITKPTKAYYREVITTDIFE